MKTIRIAGISSVATKPDILAFFSHLNPIEESLTLADYGPGTQVATVSFSTDRAANDAIKLSGRKLTPSADPTRATVIRIDNKFYGSTPLSNGSDEPGRALDIFLINRYDRHSLQLWSHLHPTTGHRTSLPLDLLPHDFPHARIILVGLQGRASRNDPKENLQAMLEEVVAAVNDAKLGRLARPAIYMGHSFGGLCLKAALVSNMAATRRLQDWCVGAVLFAVPNVRRADEEEEDSPEAKKEKEKDPKWAASKARKGSVIDVVSREFVKRARASKWYVVTVVEGKDLTVGEDAVLGLEELETVVRSSENAIGMARFGSREEEEYKQLVLAMKNIENRLAERGYAAWDQIEKWAKGQSPHCRVSLADSIYGVDEDVFLSTYGIINLEGFNFITESDDNFVVFKGDPGTGVAEFSLRVAKKLQNENNGAVYLTASKPYTTAADLWKAAVGEMADWSDNVWTRESIAAEYYKHLKTGPQETGALMTVGIMAAAGTLKYLFIHGLDQNPNKKTILTDLTHLIRVSKKHLKVVLSVQDHSDFGLKEEEISEFPLFKEDICKAHFQKFAALQLDKLREARVFGRVETLSDKMATCQDFKNIDELYVYLLSTLLARRAYDSIEDWDKARKALLFVAFAYRPLHIEELLLAVNSGEEDIWNMEVQLSEFRMFLEENLVPFLEFDVDDLGMVSLAHEHVRPFLCKCPAAWTLVGTGDVIVGKEFEDKCHLEILVTCLKALRRYHDYRNRTALGNLAGWKRKEGNPYETGLYDYASQYWVEHLKVARAAAAQDEKVGHLIARLAYSRFQDAAKGIAWNSALMTAQKKEFEDKKVFERLGINAHMNEHGRLVYELVTEQAKFMENCKAGNSVLQSEVYNRQARYKHTNPHSEPFTPDVIPLQPERLDRMVLHQISASYRFVQTRFADPRPITYYDLFYSFPSNIPNQSYTKRLLEDVRRQTPRTASYTHLSDLTRRSEFLTMADHLRHLTILYQTTGISTSSDLGAWNYEPLVNILASASQALNILATFDLPTKLPSADSAFGLSDQFLFQYDMSAQKQVYINTVTLFDSNTPKSAKQSVQLATAHTALTSSYSLVPFAIQFRTILLLSFLATFLTWSTIQYHGFIIYSIILAGILLVGRFTNILRPHWGLIFAFISRLFIRLDTTIDTPLTGPPKISTWEAPSIHNFPQALFYLCLFRILRLLMFPTDAFQSTLLKLLLFTTAWGVLAWGNLALHPFLAALANLLLNGRLVNDPAMKPWKRNLLPLWIPIDAGYLLLQLLPAILASQGIVLPEQYHFLLRNELTFRAHLTGPLWAVPLIYTALPLWGMSAFNILRTCIFVITALTFSVRTTSFLVDWSIESGAIGLLWVWFTVYFAWGVYDVVYEIFWGAGTWAGWMAKVWEVERGMKGGGAFNSGAKVEWDEGRERGGRGEMMFGGLQ
ncbi:hypothetical protein BJ508DRAFT_361400 [Ascobolus immersus RN42]|uniref:RRM domain-containing protein n=1 Tax=Ascobolus immersus RN42 TaxID=1160509 RepID=A0A3N4IKU6_ASCIM|nr:hypothetical protein BJ508DRAFT_361400 [Ascobolus immersus RN42]